MSKRSTNIKLIVCLMLAFALAFSFTPKNTIANAMADDAQGVLDIKNFEEVKFSEDEYISANESYLEREAESLKQINALLKSFYEEDRDYVLYPDWDYVYPAYYAGTYLRDGYAVIVVTDTSDDIIQKIIKATGNKDIIIEKAQYNFNQLMAATTGIRSAMEIEGSSALGCAFDEDNNTINVYVADDMRTNSQNNREIFETIKKQVIDNDSTKSTVLGSTPFDSTTFDADIFTFHRVDSKSIISIKDLTVLAGNGLNNGSAGYRAKQGSTVGILTAAHCFAKGATVKDQYGTTFGKMSSTAWLNYSYADAGFIVPDSGNSASSTIEGEQTYHTATAGTVVQYQTVRMVGKNNQSTGTVESISCWIEQLNMYDFALATYSRATGDSGGIVYTPSNRNPVGIHGGSVSDGKNNYAYFTKADRIINDMGIYPY